VFNVKRLHALAAAGAAVLALALPAAPALAAAHAPATQARHLSEIHGFRTTGPVRHLTKAEQKRIGNGPWCLTNSTTPHICLQAEGPGNQVQTLQNTGTTWTVTNTEPISGGTGFLAYQVVNANNDCLRQGTGHVVKTQNGPCDSQADDSWWIFENSGHKTNLNYAPDNMYVTNNTSGLNVWSGTIPSGGWGNWKMPFNF
jgi:hypothetical protein